MREIIIALNLFFSLTAMAWALDAPTNLRARVGSFYPADGDARLNAAVQWDYTGTSHTGFVMEYSKDGSNFSYYAKFNADVRSYVSIRMPQVVGEPHPVKWWFRIRAYEGTDAKAYLTGPFSDFSNTFALVSINPPTLLTAKLINATQVNLTWKDNSNDEAGYKIERSLDNGQSFTTIAAVLKENYQFVIDANSRQMNLYVDQGQFVADQVYTYRVKAIHALGDSEASLSVSIAPNQVPQSPRNVAVYLGSDYCTNKLPTAVMIRFKDVSNNENGFRIDRSLDGANWTLNVIPTANVPDLPETKVFYDRSVTSGKTYYYRIVAYNNVGDSAPSIKTITIPSSVPSNQHEWYVDNAVSGGLRDGSSWNNAWPTLANINWCAIAPGDTIYISGGSSGQFYDERLYAGAASFTFKTAQENGHNGKVTIKGAYLAKPGIIIDGSKDTNYLPPTTKDILNNINLAFTDTSGNCLTVTNPVGIKIKWISAGPCGSEANLGDGVILSGSSAAEIKDTELAYSHIFDIWGTGIWIWAKRNPAYGNIKVHHSIIERTHGDFMSVAGGTDIYNNIMRTNVLPQVGHADAMQVWGPYLRIYNNMMVDTYGTYIYLGHGSNYESNVRIYNNVLYASPGFPTNIAINIGLDDAPLYESITFDDYLIANNLTYNINAGHLSTGNTRQGMKLQFKNTIVKNNIFYQPEYVYGGIVSIKGQSKNVSLNPTDFVFDYNIVAGINTSVIYNDINYSTPESLNTIGFNYNVSQLPQFVDLQKNDFALAIADVIASKKGDDLSAYLSSAPDIDKDIAGTKRIAGSWDIGPYARTLEENTKVINGDVSGNGKLTIYDAALIARHAKGAVNLSIDQMDKADVNGDTNVSLYDASLVSQRAVGLIDSFSSSETGLIAYWTFDEGTGVTSKDKSGKENNVTLYNGLGWAPGKKGSSLLFSDAKHLSIVRDKIEMNNGLLNLLGSGPITITAWIYPLSWSSYGNERGDILYSGTIGFRVRGARYNRLEFSNDFFDPPVAFSPQDSIKLNQWNFVSVTRNTEGLVTFYINGVLSGAPNQPAAAIPQSTDSYRGTCIGIKCWNIADTFHGHIDELRVYDRELSEQEIKGIYEQPLN